MDLPREYRRLVCVKITPHFREAVSVVTERTPKLERDEVFLKTKYVGINASDVNNTAARYWAATPPFNVGVESVAEVVAVGDDVTHLSVGSAVATINFPGFGAFSEYQCVPASKVLPIPRAVPDSIPLLISGLTAAIGLDEQGRIKEGETVLITAAAGGLGHIAVQWAKAAKCHVIGTCSSPDKEEFLKSIGCDKVINYKTHDLGAELDKSYPKGVDVVWETIGGKTFEVLLNHLSIRGRLVVVGAITGYLNSDNGFPDVDLPDLPSRLLIRSASEGHIRVYRTREHCDRCAVFGHATDGCTSDCHLCGGYHANVDCVARWSYSSMVAGTASSDFSAFSPAHEVTPSHPAAKNEAAIALTKPQADVNPENSLSDLSEGRPPDSAAGRGGCGVP
ncbi:prostaglandin reductase 3 [Ixodes scapularis]